MIEPGKKVTIEVGGNEYESVVLKRSEQRKLLSLIRKLQSLDETIEAIETVYEIADEVAAICLPTMTEEQLEAMSNTTIFEIGGKVIAAQSMDTTTEKKSESPHSSSAASSAEHADQSAPA